jgi:hypothetical protein
LSLTVVGAYPIGGINIAAAGAVGVASPLLGLLDTLLFGPYGLGSLQRDLGAQLNSALQTQVQLGIAVADPISVLKQTLAGLGGLTAAFSAALALPLPGTGLLPAISASASISAALSLRLGGLQGLMSQAINMRLAGVEFIAALGANLSAGPVVLASWGYTGGTTTLAQAGVDISGAFVGGIEGIAPFEQVTGVLLVTKSPSASAALAATIRTI